MAFIYAMIGVWAILDPLLGALELGYPSFLNAVGLSITSPLGYSEIAGLYGGLNLCLGIMCLVGIFKRNIGIFSIKFITFLVGSIAFGRVIFSMLPTTLASIILTLFLKSSLFFVGITLLYLQKKLN